MGSTWENTQSSPGWGCLLCLQAQLKEQHPLHSKAQESPAEAAQGGRGQQGTGWDRSGTPCIQPGQGRCHSQEQQTGRTSWHQQWCWEEEGMSPGIFPDPAEPRAGGDGLRSILTSAGCRDFPGICFQKLNSFYCSPIPCQLPLPLLPPGCTPSTILPFLLPPRVTESRMPRASAPEPPGKPLAQQDTRRPQGGRTGTVAPPSSPRTVDLPSGDSGSFRAMSSSRPLEEARRMEGGSRYIPLPRNAQQGEQGNTEIVQNSVFQKNICEFWQLEHFTGEPRRGWAGMGWATWHSQQYPSPGKGKSRPDPALPARREGPT